MSRTSIRTPLSRARGLGSAHAGVHHFIAERATSIALVPLSLWAVWAAVRIAPQGYAGAVALLHSPIQAVAAALTILVSAYHMKIGMQVIVEDYVHRPGSKIMALLANSAVCWLAAALGVFCVLKVALTGAGAS